MTVLNTLKTIEKIDDAYWANIRRGMSERDARIAAAAAYETAGLGDIAAQIREAVAYGDYIAGIPTDPNEEDFWGVSNGN